MNEVNFSWMRQVDGRVLLDLLCYLLDEYGVLYHLSPDVEVGYL